jgi:hypothetical protein
MGTLEIINSVDLLKESKKSVQKRGRNNLSKLCGHNSPKCRGLGAAAVPSVLQTAIHIIKSIVSRNILGNYFVEGTRKLWKVQRLQFNTKLKLGHSFSHMSRFPNRHCPSSYAL